MNTQLTRTEAQNQNLLHLNGTSSFMMDKKGVYLKFKIINFKESKKHRKKPEIKKSVYLGCEDIKVESSACAIPRDFKETDREMTIEQVFMKYCRMPHEFLLSVGVAFQAIKLLCCEDTLLRVNENALVFFSIPGRGAHCYHLKRNLKNQIVFDRPAINGLKVPAKTKIIYTVLDNAQYN
jgi:hypothetical protein